MMYLPIDYQHYHGEAHDNAGGHSQIDHHKYDPHRSLIWYFLDPILGVHVSITVITVTHCRHGSYACDIKIE